MPKRISLTRSLLIASVLVLVPSCKERVVSVPLPPAPATIAEDQKNDTRPEYKPEYAESEAAHEKWNDDTLDWGDRRNLLAYRWCQLWNKFAEQKTDCGIDPSQR